jgi:hypothetical protein
VNAENGSGGVQKWRKTCVTLGTGDGMIVECAVSRDATLGADQSRHFILYGAGRAVPNFILLSSLKRSRSAPLFRSLLAQERINSVSFLSSDCSGYYDETRSCFVMMKFGRTS